jgi:hypothetical protein
MNENNLTSKMEINNIKFKKITILDADFLYTLLEERSSIVNISHKKIPTFLQHKKFIKLNPYSYWYMVFLKNTKIGTLYLTNLNEIGLHIKKEFKNLKIESMILEKLFHKHPRDRYLVNLNPKNEIAVKLFKKRGFKLIQHTYEFDIKNWANHE